MKKTVCAFIGCGSMANGHLNSLIKLWNAGCRDFDVAACCDIVRYRTDDGECGWEIAPQDARCQASGVAHAALARTSADYHRGAFCHFSKGGNE